MKYIIIFLLGFATINLNGQKDSTKLKNSIMKEQTLSYQTGIIFKDLFIDISIGRISVSNEEELMNLISQRIEAKFTPEELKKLEENEEKFIRGAIENEETDPYQIESLEANLKYFKEQYLPPLVKIRALIEDNIETKDKEFITELRNYYQSEIAKYFENKRMQIEKALNNDEKANDLQANALNWKLSQVFPNIMPYILQRDKYFEKVKALSDKYEMLISSQKQAIEKIQEAMLQFAYKDIEFNATIISMPPSLLLQLPIKRNIEFLMVYPDLEDNFKE